MMLTIQIKQKIILKFIKNVSRVNLWKKLRKLVISIKVIRLILLKKDIRYNR
jgi:hypothetical protein